jgi:hypothetical protein
MSGWTDDGTVVRLTTSTDQVGVGTTTPASTVKLQVEGRTRGSLEDKGGEVFNVMAYGAKGDGSVDDASAVNSAISAAPSAGAVIYFPAGTYRLDSTISWTDKPLMFTGAGTNMTIIKSRAIEGVAFTQAFSFRFTYNDPLERIKPVVFRDMRIQFENNLPTEINFDNGSILIRQLPDNVVPAQFYHGFRFENCLFRNYQVAIKLDGNSTAVIENCIFWSARESYADVWLNDTVSPDSSTNEIRNCLFADSTNTATHAVLIEGLCGGESIIGCNMVRYDIAVRLATAGQPSSSNIFIGNLFELGRTGAIRIHEKSADTIIVGNDFNFEGSNHYAILVDPGDGGFSVNGNISANRFESSPAGAIRVAPTGTGFVQGWQISSNNFVEYTVPPISLVGANVKGVLIGQNNYVDCSQPFVADSSASPQAPSWVNYLLREEEFLTGGIASNQIGEWGWFISIGTVALVQGETDHPGIIRLNSPNTSGTIGSIFPRNTGEQTGDFTYFAAIVRPSSGSTNMSFRAGLMAVPSTPAEGSQGLYWSFLAGTSANWRTITRNGSGVTSTQTSVAYTVGNWYLIEIVKNGANWEFWLNRVLAATHSANIPTGAVLPAFAIETNNAVAKQVDIDYVAMRTRNAMGQRWT